MKTFWSKIVEFFKVQKWAKWVALGLAFVGVGTAAFVVGSSVGGKEDGSAPESSVESSISVEFSSVEEISSEEESSSEEVHEHNYVGVVVKEPTCISVGEKAYSCSCGDGYTEEVPVLGHNYVGVVVKEPTCISVGEKAYSCSCGDNYAEEVPILGHNYVGVVVKEPMCISVGEKVYSCSCGDSYAEEVPILGHKLKTVTEQAATCTEIGWDSYEYCVRENCEYTTYVENFPLGHNFVDGICTLCGKKVSEGLRYELSEDSTGYEVVGIGTCTDTDLVIPSTYDNLPVTAIGRWAFAECDSLTSVVIPNSVTSIGDDAFSYCSSLTSVRMTNR